MTASFIVVGQYLRHPASTLNLNFTSLIVECRGQQLVGVTQAAGRIALSRMLNDFGHGLRLSVEAGIQPRHTPLDGELGARGTRRTRKQPEADRASRTRQNHGENDWLELRFHKRANAAHT